MAENVNISTVLKRKLKDGKEYSKLIPRVSCNTTPLGDGDTYYTVDRMKEWIEKFRHQTAKLALRFEGQTVEETVNNIYNFLYTHVQYEADGSLQQLRSPACTWKQRKQGVDCKSYSVFASSILSNLGIIHAIRQVRQPYFFPEEFTHVYVVVPKDQSQKEFTSNAPTFVLDATKHENVEVNYLEKVDLPMNKLSHVGLNAPQDERTANIISNFEKFCKHLIDNGIPVATVNAIRAEISKYTSQGLDPKFQIVDQGIVIQGKLFFLQFKNPDGLGFIATAAAAATAGKKLLDMLPPDLISDTFGAVLANGFNLGCWGASTSPSKAKNSISLDAPHLYKLSGLEQTINDTNLNKFVEYMEAYIASRKDVQGKNLADCTIEGHKAAEKLLETFYEQALEKIKQQLSSQGMGLSITGFRTVDMVTFPLKSGYADNKFRHGNVKMPVYAITKGTSSGGNYSNPTPTTTNSGSGSNSNNDGGTTTIKPTTVQTAGFGGGGQPNGVGPGDKVGSSNTGLIIGGVALASLPFLLPMIKGGNPAPKASVKTVKKPTKKTKK